MLIYAYWLLKYDTEYVLRIRQKYQYTNSLQRDLIYFIAGEDGSLAVVEDDDQSIYEFHGARTEVMLQFEAHYPNANVIRMSTSYRFCKGMIQLIDHFDLAEYIPICKKFLAFHSEEGKIEQYFHFVLHKPPHRRAQAFLCSNDTGKGKPVSL